MVYDDTDTVGCKVSTVKEAFLAPSPAAETMRVNEEKKRFMQVTKRPITLSEIDTGSYNFETVQDSKYLGTVVQKQNNFGY